VAADRPAGRVAGPVGVRGPLVAIAGRRYWRVDGDQYLAAGELVRRDPSRFRGVRLDAAEAPRLPLGWLQRAGDPTAEVPVRAAPEAGAAVVRRAAPRAIAPVLASSLDGRWVRVGAEQWVAAEDLRVARATPPPAGLLADERWLDADVDERVVVAYEGTRPVYATLFSPGVAFFPTPTGIWRIGRKVADRYMGIDLPGVVRYGIPHVAWVQYFAPLYALHVAYWHDGFGEAASHGCLNLSPLDARFLYAWAPPEVPPGWTEARADAASPGLLVRVRSRRDPDPARQGYERDVAEARRAAAAATR